MIIPKNAQSFKWVGEDKKVIQGVFMQNILKKVLIFLIFLLSFINCTGSALPIISKDDSDIFSLNVEEEKNIGFQVDTIYKNDLGGAPESVLPRNFINFIGYEGQGVIYVESSNIESFFLSLNGKSIETTKICKLKNAKIDISKDVANGRNLLFVSQIRVEGKDSEWHLKIRIPYPKLLNSKALDYNPQGLKVLETLIEEEINKGFPGCQLFIAKNGKIIKNATYGSLSTCDVNGKPLAEKKREKVSTKTLYDIASNTKIYATVFAVQKLIGEGKLSLNDKVSSFFPTFKDAKKAKIKGKDDITIRDLLLHQSGLPAGYPFINKLKDKQKNVTNKKATLNILMDIPLSYKRGSDTVYSDVGYMLLCFVVEHVSEQSLDTYVKREIYEPLGLTHITYKPLQNGFRVQDCAATEIGLAARTVNKEGFNKNATALLQGIVHDGNAYYPMNQVSGHSGLFANAESIGVLAQLILNGGGYGNIKILETSVVDMFAQSVGDKQTHALGWRRQGVDHYYSWIFSSLADKDTIGHTGWTGTFTLIDRRENLIIVLLTNAKNTRPVETEDAKGKNEGDFYLLKNYGVVPNFIYASLNNYTNQTIEHMLIELFEGRIDLHKKDSYYQNDAFIRDLYAIASTIRRMSATSSLLKTYYRGKEYKKHITYMEGMRARPL